MANERKYVRVTGLFKSKSGESLHGTVMDLDAFTKVVEEANSTGNGLVFFLHRNDRAEKPTDPIMMLSVTVGTPREKKAEPKAAPKRKPIAW